MSTPQASHHFPEDVSVAIIAYNAMQTLPLCIRSVFESGCPQAQVTVYDVASTDQTSAWLAENYPSIAVYRFQDNLGPNPARNKAVRESGRPFTLLIDADVQLMPGAVSQLRAVMDDESTAIATPIILQGSEPDRIHYYDTWVHFLAEASADVSGPSVSVLTGQTRVVGLASGCAPLIRTHVAGEVGAFEEKYFFGKTDGEFAYRINIAGYDILESDKATVLHHHDKRDSKYIVYQVCNRWHFMLKNYQLRTLVVLLPVLLIHEPVQFVFLLLKGLAGDYFRAVKMLVRMAPGLGEQRRHVAQFRRRHDWQVLRGDRLVIPIGMVKGHLVKLAAAYRVFLNGYWKAARTVLSVLSQPY